MLSLVNRPNLKISQNTSSAFSDTHVVPLGNGKAREKLQIPQNTSSAFSETHVGLLGNGKAKQMKILLNTSSTFSDTHVGLMLAANLFYQKSC